MSDPCQHLQFEASFDVHRLTNETGTVIAYAADVGIRCAHCQEPFRFLGMRYGLSNLHPAVSPDGLEARLPIAAGPDLLSLASVQGRA